MKKIIALLLLMTFCTEAATFAATINTVNQTNLQRPMNPNQSAMQNMQNIPANYNQNTNRINANQYGNSFNNSYNMNQVPYEEVQLNTNAFSNNYQSSVQNNQFFEMSPIEKLFNGKEVEVSGNPLQQVGYDLFTSTTSSDMIYSHLQLLL